VPVLSWSLYHAATRAVRKAFWEAYATFVAAFREAADRWREGDRSARFPIGSLPPGLPFRRPSLIAATKLDPQAVMSMRALRSLKSGRKRCASKGS
jgi:hypothetical protein